jgi:predicted SAM-dependent methyltransferase
MTDQPFKERTLKQRLGYWGMQRLGITQHVMNHVRLEINSAVHRLALRVHPGYRLRARRLREGKNLLANIGCGPFGLPGWVNLDLCRHPQVTLRVDCRRSLPLASGSCRGIHVEHFVEHLDPQEELPFFLSDCRRCLAPQGVLRIIVPDAERYIEAYRAPGWALFDDMGCGGEPPQTSFKTKMQALNHVFLQTWEHYGGWDAETLTLVLQNAGFVDVRQRQWREGDFPGGCIDREQHRPYSLYIEAKA